MSFKGYSFKYNTIKVLEEFGFDKPTKIQLDSLTYTLKNHNTLIEAETGSGKTFCFLLPLLENLDFEDGTLQAIIVLPTQELAMQIDRHLAVIRKIIPNFKFSNTFSSNVDLDKTGQIHITSLDKFTKSFSKKKNVLEKIQYCVFDEADMVFFDNNEATNQIFSMLPKNVVFYITSATLKDHIVNFFRSTLTNLKLVRTRNYQKRNLTNYIIDSKFFDEKLVLKALLSQESIYIAFIFCSSADEAKDVYLYLNEIGHKDICYLSSKLNNTERKNIINDISNEKYKYVVCTDLASRGIDVINTSHVINMSFPRFEEYFVHRIGRTARLNKVGTTYTIYNKDNYEKIRFYEKKYDLIFNKVFYKDEKIHEHKKESTDKEIRYRSYVERAKKLVPKNKKVKPGYKKKNKLKIEKIARKIKREEYIKNLRQQRRDANK